MMININNNNNPPDNNQQEYTWSIEKTCHWISDTNI